MSKRILQIVVTALFVSVLVNGSFGQNSDFCFEDPPGSGNWRTPLGADCVNSIITAVPFLRIVADARSAAMGDAGLAISSDPNAMHFNPSKLAFAEKNLSISATYTPWLRSLGLSDVYLAYLTGYSKLSDDEAVGVGLRYFSLGDIQFTDANGTPIGNGNPNEFELSVAYARKLSDRFSAALSAKYIYSNLAAGQQVNGVEISAGNGFAADLSFTYENVLPNDALLTFAAAITNIGSKITYTNSINKDVLPANLGIGGAYTIESGVNTFTFAADVNKLLAPTPLFPSDAEYDADNDGIPDHRQKGTLEGIFGSFGDAPGGFSEETKELMYSIGLEYMYDQQFSVRAGYYTEHLTKGNRKYVTMGLGIKYNIFGINISYLVPTTSQRSPLDNTLRFSLLFDFDT